MKQLHAQDLQTAADSIDGNNVDEMVCPNCLYAFVWAKATNLELSAVQAATLHLGILIGIATAIGAEIDGGMG